jgi:deoxyribodipyrimidine photolyase
MTIEQLLEQDTRDAQRPSFPTIRELFKLDEETPSETIARCDEAIARCKSVLEQLNSRTFATMTPTDRARFREAHDEWSLLLEQRSEAEKKMMREQASANAQSLRKSRDAALADAVKTRDVLRGNMNAVLSGAVKLGEVDRRRLANAVSVAEDHVRACER